MLETLLKAARAAEVAARKAVLEASVMAQHARSKCFTPPAGSLESSPAYREAGAAEETRALAEVALLRAQRAQIDAEYAYHLAHDAWATAQGHPNSELERAQRDAHHAERVERHLADVAAEGARQKRRVR